MKIVFLGTGTSTGIPAIGCTCRTCTSEAPEDKRLRSSILIQTKEGKSIVIDTGPDFRMQCLREDISHIEGVIYSHTHMDHIAGLDDLRRFNCLMERTITIYGTGEVLSRLKEIFPYAFSDSYHSPAIPSLVAGEICHYRTFTVEGLRILPLPIDHGGETVTCFRFGNAAYVTDCSSIPGKTLEQLKGIQVLILGALREKPHEKHFSFSQAVEMVRVLRPEVTYLTHLGHDCLHREWDPAVHGTVMLSYDGLKITLPE